MDTAAVLQDLVQHSLALITMFVVWLRSFRSFVGWFRSKGAT